MRDDGSCAFPSCHQVNLQQQEAERLNKELLEQKAEMIRLRSNLEGKEKVTVENVHICSFLTFTV